jgi:hypothetical protein
VTALTVDDVLAVAETLIWERSGGLADVDVVERLRGRAKACQDLDEDAAAVWTEMASRLAHRPEAA